ncbi:hypothetical protein QCA50_005320 [Cerrena zonata]|uniref:Uncharacterized protein n=1 Tax=Cerrena zonata TaxID=2478898 RepID=A0AAW0GRM6_9APHY
MLSSAIFISLFLGAGSLAAPIPSSAIGLPSVIALQSPLSSDHSVASTITTGEIKMHVTTAVVAVPHECVMTRSCEHASKRQPERENPIFTGDLLPLRPI